MPVAFRLFKAYETSADESYDITIANPQYREYLTNFIV